jgi:hypothetical protein
MPRRLDASEAAMTANEPDATTDPRSARERRIGRIGAIVWPSFLVASALSGLVFSVVDPAAVRGFGNRPLGWTDNSVYTLGFFVFWVACAAASAASQWLASDPPR